MDLVHSPELAVVDVILPNLQLYMIAVICVDLYCIYFAFVAVGFVSHCVCTVITGMDDCTGNLTTG